MDNRPMNAEEQTAFADGSLREANRLALDVYPKRPDAMLGGAPLYHGWVITDAFLAGVKWERERVAKEKETAKREGLLCQKCRKVAGVEDHECPFASEIHDSHDMCNCCGDCVHECAMDI